VKKIIINRELGAAGVERETVSERRRRRRPKNKINEKYALFS